MSEEIWKDIIGYEGLYQVSNLGRVMSLPKSWIVGNGAHRSHKGRMRVLSKSKSGYLSLLLNKNKQEKYHNIHRLVATAFIDNPSNFPVVNHIDENKLNNIPSNLLWCTQQNNIIHSKKKRV